MAKETIIEKSAELKDAAGEAAVKAGHTIVEKTGELKMLLEQRPSKPAIPSRRRRELKDATTQTLGNAKDYVVDKVKEAVKSV